jgi:PAS domain S-box-containing protein
VRALGVLARRSLAQRVIVHTGPDLPPIAGRATAVLFVAGYLERGATDGLYALVGTLSVEKQPFYPTMDANLGPLFAAFANHAAALQQHIRAQERARAVAGQLLRLAEVANRTSNAVIIADRAGRIEWVNESFEQLTGWRLADVQGQLPSAFLQGPRTDPLTQGQMDRAIRAGEPFDVEVVHYTRQGRQYWVQIESQVIRDEAGEPTGFVAIETNYDFIRYVKKFF